MSKHKAVVQCICWDIHCVVLSPKSAVQLVKQRCKLVPGVQGDVTENQRQLITANWGKLNLSRQGVEQAKQTMVAALSAASQGNNMQYLSDRTTSTNLAAEQVKAALEVGCILAAVLPCV